MLGRINDQHRHWIIDIRIFVVAPPTGPIITSSAKKYSFRFLVFHRCQAHFTWIRKLLFTNKIMAEKLLFVMLFAGQLLDKMLNISACTCRCRNNKTKCCTWKNTFIGTQLSHTFLFASTINYFLHLNRSFVAKIKFINIYKRRECGRFSHWTYNVTASVKHGKECHLDILHVEIKSFGSIKIYLRCDTNK